MTDTEMLDWVQAHVSAIDQDVAERVTITWFDNHGLSCQTRGVTLRDCVRGAMAGEFVKAIA